MNSTINVDKADTGSEEELFIAKVMKTLDGSLTHLPLGIEGRLDNARYAATLQVSEQQIPESVRLRLDEIRAGAMQRANAAQHKRSAAHQANGWWARWTSRGFAMPAGAFASICMLVTAVAIFNLSGNQETMPLVVTENSLVLASDVEIELYENLEFYQWLADNGL